MVTRSRVFQILFHGWRNEIWTDAYRKIDWWTEGSWASTNMQWAVPVVKQILRKYPIWRLLKYGPCNSNVLQVMSWTWEDVNHRCCRIMKWQGNMTCTFRCVVPTHNAKLPVFKSKNGYSHDHMENEKRHWLNEWAIRSDRLLRISTEARSRSLGILGGEAKFDRGTVSVSGDTWQWPSRSDRDAKVTSWVQALPRPVNFPPPSWQPSVGCFPHPLLKNGVRCYFIINGSKKIKK